MNCKAWILEFFQRYISLYPVNLCNHGSDMSLFSVNIFWTAVRKKIDSNDFLLKLKTFYDFIF